jgi:hypothetical protein
MADEKDGLLEAFKKSHKGRLHRALGVAEDETIPEDKMRVALAWQTWAACAERMAQAAHNVNE